MAKRKQRTDAKPVWWLIFLLYIAGMLWLLFGRSRGWIEGLSYRQMLQENINFKPFYTIDNYINVIFHYPESFYYRHCITNLLGNIVLFIPAGYLLPRLFGTMRKFIVFFLTVLVVMLFVESLQLLTLLGSFDVDDIILNISGMLIGYILYACIGKN